MSPRATVAAGLLAGAATALLLLIAAVALLPDPSLRARSSAAAGAASGGASAEASAGFAGSSGVESPAASAAGVVGTAIGVGVGQRAPVLRVPQVGGGSVDLATLTGRPVWIDFTQTTCDRCRDELTAMNDFAARYADAGLVVVAIDVREAESTVAGFAQAFGVTFPVGLDADGSAAEAWGVSTLPSHVWIDRDGVVRARATGPLTRQTMAADLATILPTILVTPS